MGILLSQMFLLYIYFMICLCGFWIWWQDLVWWAALYLLCLQQCGRFVPHTIRHIGVWVNIYFTSQWNKLSSLILMSHETSSSAAADCPQSSSFFPPNSTNPLWAEELLLFPVKRKTQNKKSCLATMVSVCVYVCVFSDSALAKLVKIPLNAFSTLVIQAIYSWMLHIRTKLAFKYSTHYVLITLYG